MKIEFLKNQEINSIKYLKLKIQITFHVDLQLINEFEEPLNILHKSIHFKTYYH